MNPILEITDPKPVDCTNGYKFGNGSILFCLQSDFLADTLCRYSFNSLLIVYNSI